MRNYKCIENLLNRNSKLFMSSDTDIIDDEDIKKIESIKEIKVDDLIFAIMVRDEVEINPRDVPMYSSFKDCTENICKLLDVISNVGMEFDELGGALLGYIAKNMAHYKYGESHSKAAEILGLVKIEKIKNGKNKVFLTKIGQYYANNETGKKELILRLLLSSKIIQKIVKNHENGCMVKDLISFLSHTTIVRRMPNIKTFVKELIRLDEDDFIKIIEKVDFSTHD